MTYTQVLTSLSTLSENELRCLNSAVIDQLKAIRDLQAAQNRRLFKAGDKVYVRVYGYAASSNFQLNVKSS